MSLTAGYEMLGADDGRALTWKNVGPFAGAGLTATCHRFRSDRLDTPYGTEWDLLASAKRGRTALSARYARNVSRRTPTSCGWRPDGIL